MRYVAAIVVIIALLAIWGPKRSDEPRWSCRPIYGDRC